MADEIQSICILGLESKPKGRASKTMKDNNKNADNTCLSERQELIRLREENRRLEIAIPLEKSTILSSKNQTKK